MRTKQQQDALIRAIVLSVLPVSLLWMIQSAGELFNLPLSLLGVVPHDVSRLYGIVTSPLVHGSFEHLFNDTLPLIILGAGLIYGYPKARVNVLLLSWLISGVGIWLFGRPSVHLGASGVSHGLFFFIFVVSIMRRDAKSVGLMMIAFFLYGGMVMTIFPRDPAISYEAHFFGALGGVIAALFFGRQDAQPMQQRYSWEKNDEEDPIIGDDWKSSSKDEL